MNQKGYTLITVILTFACLSILGIALLAVTMTGMKMRVQDAQKQSVFYIAEAGLDSVYAILSQDVQTCYTSATAIATGRVQADIDREWADYKDALEMGTVPPSLRYFDGNGVLLASEAAIAAVPLYETEFIDQFNGCLTGKYSLPIVDDGTKKITLLSTPLEPLTGGAPASMTFQSEYHETDGTLRAVQLTFTVTVPAYTPAVSVTTNVLETAPHILLTKAFATEQDIVFLGEDIVVNGDIYAGGTGATASLVNGGAFMGYTRFGGVTAGGGSRPAQVVINGHVATSANVQIYSSSSSLDITGDVHGGNIAVHEQTRVTTDFWHDSQSYTIGEPLTDGHLRITGTVRTKNKLILGGQKSDITITGDYYGFSSTTTDAYETSSSILINSDDIAEADGSSLSVSGETYIAGVGFLDITETGETYKLGESVSVKGNYVAYGFPLEAADLLSVGPGYDQYSYDAVEFDQVTDYFLAANRFIGSATPFEPIPHRANYFYAAGNIPQWKDLLNLGFGGSIRLGTVQYSLGCYINGGLVGNSTGDWSDMSPFQSAKDAYNLAVGQFGDSHIGDGIAGHSFSPSAIFGTDGLVQGSPPSADVTVSRLTYPDAPIDSVTGRAVINDVIVTRGHVFIEDNIDFRGAIIAGGNIIVTGSHVTMTNGLRGFDDYFSQAQAPALNVMLTQLKKTGKDSYFPRYAADDVYPAYRFIDYTAYAAGFSDALDGYNLDMKDWIAMKDWKRIR